MCVALLVVASVLESQWQFSVSSLLFSLSLSLSLTHTHSHTHTHTHIHNIFVSLTHTHTFSVSESHSITLSHTLSAQSVRFIFEVYLISHRINFMGFVEIANRELRVAPKALAPEFESRQSFERPTGDSLRWV